MRLYVGVGIRKSVFFGYKQYRRLSYRVEMFGQKWHKCYVTYHLFQQLAWM